MKTDLLGVLYRGMKRLGDKSLTGEKLKKEIKHTDAILAAVDKILHKKEMMLKN